MPWDCLKALYSLRRGHDCDADIVDRPVGIPLVPGINVVSLYPREPVVPVYLPGTRFVWSHSWFWISRISAAATGILVSVVKRPQRVRRSTPWIALIHAVVAANPRVDIDLLTAVVGAIGVVVSLRIAVDHTLDTGRIVLTRIV